MFAGLAIIFLSLVPSAEAAGPGDIWASDAHTLAIFELNGDLTDSSGDGRDAVGLATPSFVLTGCGEGLALPGTDPQGFDWSAHAALLTHPFTVEMVVIPENIGSGWRKLFSHADGADAGWYYHGDDFQSFPDPDIDLTLGNGEIHYWALVSTSTTTMDVYLDGALVGSTPTQFTAPPGEAVFFRDDSATGRVETLEGVVDGVRLSSTTRTTDEMSTVVGQLDSACGEPPVPVPELSGLALVSVGLVGLAAVAVARRRR